MTPRELLIQNGYKELAAEEIYDLESEDYFYLTERDGVVYYFKSKEKEEN